MSQVGSKNCRRCQKFWRDWHESAGRTECDWFPASGPGKYREKYRDLSRIMFGSELYGRMYLEFLRGYENGYQVNAVVPVCEDYRLPGRHGAEGNPDMPREDVD